MRLAQAGGIKPLEIDAVVDGLNFPRNANRGKASRTVLTRRGDGMRECEKLRDKWNARRKELGVVVNLAEDGQHKAAAFPPEPGNRKHRHRQIRLIQTE